MKLRCQFSKDGHAQAAYSGSTGYATFIYLRSLKALIDVRETEFGARGSRRDFRDAAFYYPLVVLEGELFAARLSHGRLVVRSVPCVPASISYRSPQYPEDEHFTVMVAREQFMPRLLARLARWQEFCASYLSRQTSHFRKERAKARRRTRGRT
jgi:hypothetical protein